MPVSFSYLFLELAVLATILTFAWDTLEWQLFLSRQFIFKVIILFFLWLALDQLAIFLNLWSFPQGGSLRMRFLRLPPEEYLLFVIHTMICALLVNLFSRAHRQ